MDVYSPWQESVKSLRYRLFQLGLDFRGTKQVLIDRLAEASAKFDEKIDEGKLYSDQFSSFDANTDICHGQLVHKSVWVTNRKREIFSSSSFRDIQRLCSSLSGFGKGSLSRSIPVFGTAEPEAARGKAARQRSKLSKNISTIEKVAVYNLLQYSTPRFPYKRKLNPPVDIASVLTSPETDNSSEEHLQLFLWEAFYASFVLNRLRIFDWNDSSKELVDANTTYQHFCRLVPDFPFLLAVYSYYRQKGWSPHSGLKYGVDFVLYHDWVENHVHSPFCVLLHVHSNNRDDSVPLEKSWCSLQNRLRLAKQVAKQLVIVQVKIPEWLSEEDLFSTWENFKSLEILELVVERWTAANKRGREDGLG
eukprot:jgi/Galph1/5236/GphlegSOOS_G3871.1